MFDNNVFIKDTCKNVEENGKVIGFEMQTHITYYRAIPLSLLLVGLWKMKYFPSCYQFRGNLRLKRVLPQSVMTLYFSTILLYPIQLYFFPPVTGIIIYKHHLFADFQLPILNPCINRHVAHSVVYRS